MIKMVDVRFYRVRRRTDSYSMATLETGLSKTKKFYTKEDARKFLQEDWENALNGLYGIKDIDMKNSFHEDDLAVISDSYGNRIFWWIETTIKEKEEEMQSLITKVTVPQGYTTSSTVTANTWPDVVYADIANAYAQKSVAIAVPKRDLPKIKKVIFNKPATIVLWSDGTKTVVKVKKKEKYDKWVGLAMCHMKKYYGEKFHKTFRDWCEKEP